MSVSAGVMACTDARLTSPVSKSFTNTSVTPLVSLATKLLAPLENVTYRPSADILALVESPNASAPDAVVDTR